MNQIDALVTNPLSPVQKLFSETGSALLVIDMQIDFCAEDGFVASIGLDSAPCRDIVPALAALIDTARQKGVPVLWVLANYDNSLVPATFQRRKLEAGIERDCCVPGTEGYEPFGVYPAEGEPSFDKHSYSAFTNSKFESYLRAQNIETLVFTGVQTNVCVEATIREAYNRGFHVVVAEDCVASHTPQLHDATLQNVRALMGCVAPSTEIERSWEAVS